MKIRLMVTNGIRWAEIDDGRIDLAVYGGELVSINAEYAHHNMTPRGVPNPKGIRWKDDPTKLTESDFMWLEGNEKL